MRERNQERIREKEHVLDYLIKDGEGGERLQIGRVRLGNSPQGYEQLH